MSTHFTGLKLEEMFNFMGFEGIVKRGHPDNPRQIEIFYGCRTTRMGYDCGNCGDCGHAVSLDGDTIDTIIMPRDKYGLRRQLSPNEMSGQRLKNHGF